MVSIGPSGLVQAHATGISMGMLVSVDPAVVCTEYVRMTSVTFAEVAWLDAAQWATDGVDMPVLPPPSAASNFTCCTVLALCRGPRQVKLVDRIVMPHLSLSSVVRGSVLAFAASYSSMVRS